MSTTDPVTILGDDTLVPPEEQSSFGHNSEANAFERALRAQISLNAERDELNARISKARKGFKADGVVLGKLDDIIKKMAWTPQEQREDLAVTLRYMTYAGFSIGSLSVPEGGQVDMFGHTDDEEVSRADWKARGRADALRLKPAKVPDNCPEDRAQDYLAGHAEAKWWQDESPIGRETDEWVDQDDAPEWTDEEFAQARREEGIE